MKTIPFLFILQSIMNCGLTLQLPASFVRCKVGPELDNKPNECLRNSIEQAVINLSDGGYPELGLGDMDPFDADNFIIATGDGPLAVKLGVPKGQVFGYSKIKVSSVSGRLSSANEFKMTIKYSVEKVKLSGVYDISGRIIILPISGKGNGNTTFVNYKGTFVIAGTSKMKNGKEYLKITDTNLDFAAEKVIFKIENLFNGNKQLNEIMNKFLNDNWEEIMNYGKTFVAKIFNGVFETYAKKIFEKIPFDEIFLTS